MHKGGEEIFAFLENWSLLLIYSNATLEVIGIGGVVSSCCPVWICC